MARNESALKLYPYWREASAFAIVVGIAILAIWAYMLGTGSVPELDIRPLATWLHIAGEVVTALLLIAAGIGLLRHSVWGRRLYIFATAALLFEIIHAVGFYGERGDVAMVLFFLLVALLGIFFALRAEE